MLALDKELVFKQPGIDLAASCAPTLAAGAFIFEMFIFASAA
jgi:hypothetical protein